MNDQITPYDHVCIMGCGDIGLRVARRWMANVAEPKATGPRVTGTAQSDSSIARLLQAAIEAVKVDLDDNHPELPVIGGNGLVYYFVAPPNTGTKDNRCQHFLASLSQQDIKPICIVAISTTGIYGDCSGELINEQQVPKPTADRAKRRYDMESQLKSWCEINKVRLIILRVGGIYGPQRLPITRIKKGIPVLHETLAPKTNRIHQEDLADICVAAAHSEYAYRIYNVSDGTESNMTEYFYKIADHCGLPRPPAVDWQEAERVMSKGMLSYLRESRRVDNSRMLNELKVRLRYPTLESGLAEIDCKED